MQDLLYMYLRSLTPRIDPTSALLDDLEVLYERCADSQVFFRPKPICFTIWPGISLISVLTSSLMESAGKKASIKASSMGPIRVTTPWTVFCRYCHLIWSDTPYQAYTNWGYCLAILPRMRTSWDHASTFGRTHFPRSSMGPK